jgi:uncharacterized protein (TIGR02145 family)
VQKIVSKLHLYTRSIYRLLHSSKVILIFFGVVAFSGITATAASAAVIDSPKTIPYIAQPITTMQEMTTSYCSDMPLNSTMTLEDTRNHQLYRVRKMPDNNCWMIDNLKLATPGNVLRLTPGDSNVTADFDIPANPVNSTSTHSNGRCDSTGMADGSGFLTCNGTLTSSVTNDQFAAYTDPTDPDPAYIAAAADSCIEGNFVDPASTTGCGYLYNWYTATAGASTSGGPVKSSICPKGWYLPAANSVSSMQYEFVTLNSAMYDWLMSSPMAATATARQNWWHTGLFAGPRSGYYWGDSLFVEQGTMGYFWGAWLSRSGSQSFGVGAYFSHNIVSPNGAEFHGRWGLAVRCLAA